MATTTLDATPHRAAPAGFTNPLAASNISTQPQNNTRARSIALATSALLAPLALGASVGALRQSPRAGLRSGLLAAAASALGAGFLRWQLARWFTDEPAYIVEDTIDALEIRRYMPRVEAHTRFATLDFDDVRSYGFRRLASYIFGGNAAHRKLAMTSPVTVAPRAGSHTMAFVMPPGIPRAELPEPDDSRIALVDVAARRVVALRYRGRYDARTFERQAARLRDLAAQAGLTTIGEPVFAGFDPPSTLPFLRRAEVWLELV